MNEPRTERWFYLDGFDANEFCPLWHVIDRYQVWWNPPYNWCRVHYELGDDQPIIQAPLGSYHHFALDRVNEAIG